VGNNEKISRRVNDNKLKLFKFLILKECQSMAYDLLINFRGTNNLGGYPEGIGRKLKLWPGPIERQ
jgi:hypothetical protein